MADPAQLPADPGAAAASIDLTSALAGLQLGFPASDSLAQGAGGLAAAAAGAREAAAAAAPASGREATIGDLPDEVLARMFGFMAWNRLPSAAMVCRRWHAVARSCGLASVGVKVGGRRGAAYACSVLAWLQLYGAARMHRLHLDVIPPPGGAAEAAAMAAAAEALLQACAASGRLTWLRVAVAASVARTPWPPLRAGAWLGGLPALQTLHLSSESLLEVPAASLAPLTALQQCELRGRPLQLPPDARLPASLRSLVLGGLETPPPPQIAELSRLTRLALPRLRCAGSGAALAFLPALPALRELELSHCEVPPCLPRLAALTALALERVWLHVPAWEAAMMEAEEEAGEGGDEEADGAAAAMRAALAPLSALRRLALRTVVDLPRVPPVVTALPTLQHLEWRGLF